MIHAVSEGAKESFSEMSGIAGNRALRGGAECEHDEGLSGGRGMHKPIIKGVKELSCTKQCHEDEFSNS